MIKCVLVSSVAKWKRQTSETQAVNVWLPYILSLCPKSYTMHKYKLFKIRPRLPDIPDTCCAPPWIGKLPETSALVALPANCPRRAVIGPRNYFSPGSRVLPPTVHNSSPNPDQTWNNRQQPGWKQCQPIVTKIVGRYISSSQCFQDFCKLWNLMIGVLRAPRICVSTQKNGGEDTEPLLSTPNSFIWWRWWWL